MRPLPLLIPTIYYLRIKQIKYYQLGCIKKGAKFSSYISCSHSYLQLLQTRQFIKQNKMAHQIKNNRIETLEPSKLSESIKSRNEDKKNPPNISYPNFDFTNKEESSQVYQEVSKRVMTQTQEIYGSGEAPPHERSFTKQQNILHIDKLNELKKEYQILRNIKIDDSFIYEQKAPKRAQSSAEPSENNSVRSNRTNSKIHKNNHGIIQYQKKQLELMLANSMSKIEELLKAEVEYKRKIYELTKLNPENQHGQLQEKLKNAQSIGKASQQTINRLKAEEERLRNMNFNLTDKIRSIESQNFNLETQIRRTIDEKRKSEQTLYLEKQSHMNTKIEIKKRQLEKQMLQKQKNAEIQRLKRTINQLTNENERLSSNARRQLSQIDQLKQKITKLLAQETLQQLRKKEQKEQKIQRISKQKSENASSEQFQKKLSEKIKQLHKADEEAMRKEISQLKEEMENMKENHEQTSEQVHLQIRIAALEKIINEDNDEKMSFLDELRRIIKDFQELEAENEQLKQKLRKLQRQLSLQKENASFQIDRLQKSQMAAKASNDLDQLNNYLTKLRKLEAENKDLRLKASRMEESLSNQGSRVQEKIREYSRKLEDSELELEKAQRQYEFNLQILQVKHKSEIEMIKNDAARASKERQEQRQKHEQVKASLQGQVEYLKKQKEQLIKNWKEKIQQKEGEIHEYKVLAESNRVKYRQDHQKQLFTLLGRLDQLIESNERYAIQNTRLLGIEGELYELRQRNRKMMGLSQGVDHLWQVKEAEYYNVDLLLKELKG